MERLLSSREAAALLGIDRATLDAHVHAGEIEFITTGQGTKRPRRRFDVRDLEGFRDRRRKQCYARSPARLTGTTISPSTTFDFAAARRQRISARQRRSKPGTGIANCSGSTAQPN